MNAALAVVEDNTFKVAADLWLEKKIRNGRAENLKRHKSRQRKNLNQNECGHRTD